MEAAKIVKFGETKKHEVKFILSIQYQNNLILVTLRM
jgi:hypothetical protein